MISNFDSSSFLQNLKNNLIVKEVVNSYFLPEKRSSSLNETCKVESKKNVIFTQDCSLQELQRARVKGSRFYYSNCLDHKKYFKQSN